MYLTIVLFRKASSTQNLLFQDISTKYRNHHIQFQYSTHFWSELYKAASNREMDNGYRPTKDGVRSGRWLSLCEVSSVRVERNCMTIYYQLLSFFPSLSLSYLAVKTDIVVFFFRMERIILILLREDVNYHYKLIHLLVYLKICVA